MKIFSLILLYSLLSFEMVCAQNVVGQIANEQGEPVAYASCVLLLASDSAYVSGTVSDTKGRFVLDAKEGVEYLLQVSYVGYQMEELKCQTGDVGTVVLKEDAQLLEEVVVKADRPLMQMKGSRMVFEASVLDKLEGKKAPYLLSLVPQVSSFSGNLYVGSNSATVYVNDRRLNGNELTTYLQNLDADRIDRVEVQNMRSSDVAGNISGGVIYIYTKAPQLGLSGNVSLYGSTPRAGFYDWSPDATWYWGTEKWNLYGSYAYDQDKYGATGNTVSSMVQNNMRHTSSSSESNRKLSHVYKLGSTVNIADNHTLNVEFNGNNNRSPEWNRRRADVLWEDLLSGDNETGVMTSQSTSSSQFYNAGVLYNWKFDGRGSFFKLLANYNHRQDNGLTQLSTVYDKVGANDFKETNETRSLANSYSVQGDVKKKLESDWELEGGLFYQSTYRRSFLGTELNGGYTASDWLSSEKITAGYFEVNKTFSNGLYLSASLRVEHTNMTGAVDDNASLGDVDRKYTDFLPFVYMSKSLGKNFSTTLAYTRFITRPSFRLLTNYSYRASDVLYDIGNPDLDRSIADVFQWQLTGKGHVLMIQYLRTNDCINEVFEERDGVIYHTNQNYGYEENLLLYYGWGKKVTDWWMVNLNGWGGYAHVPKSYNKTHLWYGSASLVNNLSFDKVGDLSLSVNARTPSIGGNAYRKGYATADIEYTYHLKKWNFTVGVDDVFNSVKTRSHQLVPTLDYSVYIKRQTRQFYVSVSYSFATKNKVTRQKMQNSNAVKSRL